MSPSRWALAVLLLSPVAAEAQKKGAPPEPPISVTLPTEPKWERRLAAAQDYIDEKDWQRATMLLQSAFDVPVDAFINVKRRAEDGKEVTQRTSVRAETEQMMRALPAEGLAYYRNAYNTAAADLLKEAKTKESLDLLDLIARRYQWTDSGPEALELLADRAFRAAYPQPIWNVMDRPLARPRTASETEDLFRAAWAFDRLLDLRGGAGDLDQAALFKATVAYRLIGDHAKAERMWQALRGRVAKEGLRLTKHAALEQLRTLIDSVADWPMFGGDPSRSAQGKRRRAFPG